MYSELKIARFARYKLHLNELGLRVYKLFDVLFSHHLNITVNTYLLERSTKITDRK